MDELSMKRSLDDFKEEIREMFRKEFMEDLKKVKSSCDRQQIKIETYESRLLQLENEKSKRNIQGTGGNRGLGGGQQPSRGGRNIQDVNKYSPSKNAWKPSRLTKSLKVMSKDERDTENLYKKVRSILNKLTARNFDTLVAQFQRLPLNNADRLQGTGKLIFHKAVNEPIFSSVYANLCRTLFGLHVTKDSGGVAATARVCSENVYFRKMIITRCQKEFETNKRLEFEFETRQYCINKIQDLEKRRELQLLLNEEDHKIRMYSVGLVTFIGELFKLKMLTTNIMNNCIKQLLGKIEEESLECLCKLLTTIGKEFEEQISDIKSAPGGMSEFNDFFQQMKSLREKHKGSKVSNRVWFMVQDVIELRQNHWVPRQHENITETLDQIQEEVERDESATYEASQGGKSKSFEKDTALESCVLVAPTEDSAEVLFSSGDVTGKLSNKPMLSRVDTFESILNRLEGRLDKWENCFNRLEGKLDKLKGSFKRSEKSLGRLEGRFDKLEKHFNTSEEIFDSDYHGFNLLNDSSNPVEESFYSNDAFFD